MDLVHLVILEEPIADGVGNDDGDSIDDLLVSAAAFSVRI